MYRPKLAVGGIGIFRDLLILKVASYFLADRLKCLFDHLLRLKVRDLTDICQPFNHKLPKFC